MRKVKGPEVLAQPTQNNLNILTKQDLEYIYNPNIEKPEGFIDRLTQWSNKVKELYEKNK